MDSFPPDFLREITSQKRVSDAEFQALHLALQGNTANVVAKILNISAPAVRKRLGEVYQKFGLTESLPGPGKLEVLRNLLREEFDHYSNQIPQTYKDWDGAVNVSKFVGRNSELVTLERYILSERSRLIVLLGIGGVGKTSLAVKLGERVEKSFEYEIWRSLKNRLPLTEFIKSLFDVLCDENTDKSALEVDVSNSISKLLEMLRFKRCLVVLDDAESIFQKNWENPHRFGYGELLRRIGSESHKSCFVLTSREKPSEVSRLEEYNQPVRTLVVTGLQSDGEKLLHENGLSGSSQEMQELVDYYDGNPLALNIISTSIKRLFSGNVSEFLGQLKTYRGRVFGGITELLNQQFDSLPEIGRDIMYWLAINREPITALELQNDFMPPPIISDLYENLEEMRSKSLINTTSSKFTLHNYLMEYFTERLVNEIANEIKEGNFDNFNKYALIKSSSQNYTRDAQTEFILKPVVERLLTKFGNKVSLKSYLTEYLANLKRELAFQPGYAAGNLLNILVHLSNDLHGLNFSQMHVRQAYLKNVYLPNVDFSECNLSKSSFTETLGCVLSVAFQTIDSDNTLLALGDHSGRISLWQFADDQPIRFFEGHDSRVWSVAFSSDGLRLVSGSEDQTIKIWDSCTSECLKTLEGHSNWVWSVSFSPDSQKIVSGSEDQTIKIWEVESGKCIHTLTKHTNRVTSVAWSPDGSMLASGSGDHKVNIWNAKTGKYLHELEGHMERVTSVVWSSDSKLLASCSVDTTIKIWDAKKRKCLNTLSQHTDRVKSVVFSPNGKMLASGGDDEIVRVWDIVTGECLHSLRGHTNWIWSVAFSPDNRTLASGSEDLTARIWDVESGKCLNTLQGYTNRVWSVAFGPCTGSKVIVSGSDDQKIRVWNSDSLQCIKSLVGHTNRVTSVTFSPLNGYVISGSDDQTLRLWDLSSSQCINVLVGHTNRITSVAANSKLPIVASGSQDQTVRIWNLQTGQCLKVLSTHESWVRSVAFSPDGRFLASGSDDNSVKLWDTKTWNCINTLEGHTNQVWAVAFSPNSKFLASGSEDNTVRIWSIDNNQYYATLKGHKSRVWSVAFSPDGQTLASGGDDQTIRLWNIDTAKSIESFRQKHWIRSVAFSCDGQMLICSGEDSKIVVLEIKSGNQRSIRNPMLYEGMRIKNVEGLEEYQKDSLKALGATDV